MALLPTTYVLGTAREWRRAGRPPCGLVSPADARPSIDLILLSFCEVQFILDDSDRHKPKAKDVKYRVSAPAGPHLWPFP